MQTRNPNKQTNKSQYSLGNPLCSKSPYIPNVFQTGLSSFWTFQVYLPCVLQTKKRYVGYMYETLDQKDPVFDAKGIETVRRDSCPAVSKVKYS